LHSKIQVKISMLVELCVGNYAIHDGLFHWANGVFQYVSKLHDNESLIWIIFIIQKQVLQLGYEINICTQPTFQNIGHQYNQFLKRYKWVLIQTM
jgi:hypothetical protein